MSKRQRMTWASLTREAATAPAIPGYGVEDQDHPAHSQDDPEATDYMIGGPSEFGEDVHPGPYGDSGEPALPGYGVEDQDHPAHKGQVGRKGNLIQAVRKHASKCLKLAQVTLGNRAKQADIEDQALNFMSMEASDIDAALQRMGGGFLADFDDDMMDPGGFDLVDDIDDIDAVPFEDDFGGGFDGGMDIMARLESMQAEIATLKAAAGQNDPAGKTLGTSGKSEQEEKKEETAVSNKSAATKVARAKLARLFAACDMDNDGFVMAEDWMGPQAVFAALDTDGDGIIAKHEVMAGEVPEAFKKQWEDKKDDDKGEDKKDDAKEDKKASKKAKKAEDEEEVEEETASKKKAGKKAEDEEEVEEETASKKKAKKAEEEEEVEETASKKKAKKAEDEEEVEETASKKKAKSKKAEEEEEVEEETASKKKAKKAEDEEEEEVEEETASKKKAKGKKADFGQTADFDADELAMLNAMTASEEETEEETEGDKEASFFSDGFDPMGLSGGNTLTAADLVALDEVFGKQGGEETEEETEEETGKEAARLASLLRPQPRKASSGVKSVGAVSKQASTGREIKDLSDLWTSDPDVSGSFT